MWANFNINHYVRVQLSERGKAVHRQWHADLYRGAGLPVPDYRPPSEDAEGWSKWQFWTLMHELGGHEMCMGPPVLFKTGIQIELPDNGEGKPT